jgi:DNA modification methylase
VAPVGYLETGVIYCDDNLQRLAQFPAECVDLIYLDPPFFSNRNYEVIWGDEAEVRSFEDRWEGGIQVYIEWMRDRVIELYRILKPTGSIYLHCDWHASHYLKVMMDEVFGARQFRNEIIWAYSNSGRPSDRYAQKHDSIFWYGRGGGETYFDNAAARIPYSQEYIESHFRDVDDKGRRVRRRLDAGKWRLYYPESGMIPNDVWTDIPSLNSVAKERLGYPTQKPEALLERIIIGSTRPGDIVLDPFCGCGTTLVAAQKLGRRWIGIDISPTAVELEKRRLAKVGAFDVKLVGMPATEADLRKLKPFEFQNWIIQRVNGTHSPKKSGDMGIDGLSFLQHHPIQVKQSDKIGRNVVDNFETAIQRVGRKKGYIVAFSFGPGAKEEVARARTAGLEIVLVKVADLITEVPDIITPRTSLFETEGAGDLLPQARPADARPSVGQLIASASAEELGKVAETEEPYPPSN